jgi:gingipain R
MRSLIIALLIIACTFACAEAKWVAVNSQTPAPIKMKVLENTKDIIKLEVTIPGYFTDKVKILDKEVMWVYMPQTAVIMQKGCPTLPKFATAVKLGNDCGVELKVSDLEEVEYALACPIIPSKGHLNRNVDPESIDYSFGSVYEEDAFWPGEQFSVGKPFIWHNVRGVRVNVLPMTVNHVQKVLKVVKKAVITLNCKSTSTVNTLQTTRRSYRNVKAISKMQADYFVNYEEENTRSGVPAENNKKLIVVCPQQFEAAIADWVAWKKKCGYQVLPYVFVEGSVSASEIKAFLQMCYDDPEERFGYVVLIGDANNNSNFEEATPMPTFKGSKEGAAADRVYVRLAGNDNYPDAFISRISATTAQEVKDQLAKIINYEKSAAGEWLARNLCVAGRDSGGGFCDYERATWLQLGGSQNQKVSVVAGGMKGAGYEDYRQVFPSTGTTVANVAKHINEGVGIVCYIGHGSSTSWGTTGFSNSDIANLKNGAMLPVIWSVACVNGNFLKTAVCYAEAWLRKVNGGAVAMEAASTNESWIPPCDKQAATINAIITGKYSTFGALEAEGAIAGLINWGDTNSSEGNKMVEQCNLFGDCTMIVKTAKSAKLSVYPSRYSEAASFQVCDEMGNPANATVTVYNADLSFVVSCDTDEDGMVDFSLIEAPAEQLYYTIVGQNIESIVDAELN